MQNQGSQSDKILPGTPRVAENIGQISCSTDRQTHKKTDRGQGEMENKDLPEGNSNL